MSKVKPQTIISPTAEEYSEAHSTMPSTTLQEIERWAHLNTPQPRMLAGAWQGELLRLLSLMLMPRLAVEVGSFVGYSTICLAAGATMLHAIEVDSERENQILKNLNKAGLADRVTLHIGDAHTVLPTLPNEIDLAFVDADKQHTQDYYDLIIPKLSPGGILLIDNVLWSGKVLSASQPCNPEAITSSEETRETDADTAAVLHLNDYIQHDSRVENILIPVRDGLMLCRKIPSYSQTT